uniref:Uncharacterized protein n=1 Tax=Micrurus surinamensis TaxID=129470 RepID=A0A2D4PS24_MICSU
MKNSQLLEASCSQGINLNLKEDFLNLLTRRKLRPPLLKLGVPVDSKSGEGRNTSQQLIRFSLVASLLPHPGGNTTALLAPSLSSHLTSTHLPAAASTLGRAQDPLCIPPFAH